MIRGVTVRPSTGLLAEYFAALGQKPISGPVDATNFGWLAMGQPTHVFDFDTLEGGIVVRRAHAGERLRLLDGTERTLTADDLVVADQRKALGLAGVMGGWDSRVTEGTRNILVEAAWFDPAAIRASSRRHGLHTDASHRFERGADFNAAATANHLVTRLVLEQAGGHVAGPLVDITVPAVAAKTADRPHIVLRVPEVQRLLGTTMDDAVLQIGEHTSGHSASISGISASISGITDSLVVQYLSALGCELEPTNAVAGEFGVKLPSWRLDLEREIDLIEEVARVYGYNQFANTLPGWAGAVVDQPHKAQEAAMRSTLRALGYTEAISSTFVSAADADAFGPGAAGVVPLGNPLNEEAGILRPSLLPGVVSMLGRNLARGIDTVRLFELGTVFLGSPAEVHEQAALVLGLTTPASSGRLYRAEDTALFTVKGALETLLSRFTGELRFEFGPAIERLPSWVAPGRGARVLLDGKHIAVFGELRPEEIAARKLRQNCIFAAIDAATLFRTPLRQPALRELSRFQSVERDFSFLLPDAIPWSAIQAEIARLGLPEVQGIQPLEIFRDPKGKAIPRGSYSLLLRVVVQSPNHTLTDEELTQLSERVPTAITALGGVQRAPE